MKKKKKKVKFLLIFNPMEFFLKNNIILRFKQQVKIIK